MFRILFWVCWKWLKWSNLYTIVPSFPFYSFASESLRVFSIVLSWWLRCTKSVYFSMNKHKWLARINYWSSLIASFPVLSRFNLPCVNIIVDELLQSCSLRITVNRTKSLDDLTVPMVPHIFFLKTFIFVLFLPVWGSVSYFSSFPYLALCYCWGYIFFFWENVNVLWRHNG